MMNIWKYVLGFGLWVAFASAVQGAQYNPPEVNRSGIIESIDFSNSEMVVEGNRYSVSWTVDVEIGGTYGAFTMLNPGMRIEFVYLRHEAGQRVVMSVRELLPNETLERA